MPNRRETPARRGSVIIYGTVIWVGLCAMVSLGVDYGRVQLAKRQLGDAADAAARYAAKGILDGTAAARAISAAGANAADGSPVVLEASDVQVGTWNAGTRQFTAGGMSPNAACVTARRTAARGTAVPLTFASLFGRSSVDVTAVSIVAITQETTTTITVPGRGNPWLAGMPAGTTGNWYDSAPSNSPTAVSGLSITPGTVLNFGFSGSVSYYPGTQPFDPDGNAGWIINNYAGAEHGMANLNAPLTSVVGVFLGDDAPDATGAPAGLNFSDGGSRNFATLSPGLKQPFFIGNGYRDDGVTLQNFVTPPGATRLYIGVMDGQQWSDNAGALTTTVVKPAQITIVK